MRCSEIIYVKELAIDLYNRLKDQGQNPSFEQGYDYDEDIECWIIEYDKC